MPAAEIFFQSISEELIQTENMLKTNGPLKKYYSTLLMQKEFLHTGRWPLQERMSIPCPHLMKMNMH